MTLKEELQAIRNKSAEEGARAQKERWDAAVKFEEAEKIDGAKFGLVLWEQVVAKLKAASALNCNQNSLTIETGSSHRQAYARAAEKVVCQKLHDEGLTYSSNIIHTEGSTSHADGATPYSAYDTYTLRISW